MWAKWVVFCNVDQCPGCRPILAIVPCVPSICFSSRISSLISEWLVCGVGLQVWPTDGYGWPGSRRPAVLMKISLTLFTRSVVGVYSRAADRLVCVAGAEADYMSSDVWLNENLCERLYQDGVWSRTLRHQDSLGHFGTGLKTLRHQQRVTGHFDTSAVIEEKPGHFDPGQFRWHTAPPVIRLKLRHQFCGADVSRCRSVLWPKCPAPLQIFSLFGNLLGLSEWDLYTAKRSHFNQQRQNTE